MENAYLTLCVVVLAAAPGMGGCGGSGGGARVFDDYNGVEIELPDGEILAAPNEIVEFTNARGEDIMGVMVYPDARGPRPAVIVLHGAGGLFTSPDSNDVLLEVAPQFAEWASMLVDEGYVALFPSSFLSRGYYDWHDAPNELDDEDRLRMRVFDAHAALSFACNHPAVACGSMALMGFSNGASATLLALHEDLGKVAGLERLGGSRLAVQVGVAYYPGCGMQGFVPMSAADGYFPYTKVTIQHGEDDSLVDDCEDRAAQTEATASLRSQSSPLDLIIYDNAGHGFDSSPNSGSERSARDASREHTLELFRADL